MEKSVFISKIAIQFNGPIVSENLKKTGFSENVLLKSLAGTKQ